MYPANVLFGHHYTCPVQLSSLVRYGEYGRTLNTLYTYNNESVIGGVNDIYIEVFT